MNNNHQFNRTYSRPMVVAQAMGDVTGDKVPDHVYLTGTKTTDSPFVQQITLHVRDGRTGALTSVSLKENVGYSPALFLGDFTGNGVNEILISSNTGGSGGIMNYYIVSYLDNKPRLLFDFEAYNNLYEYTITYRDYYKVEVISKMNNEKYIIDISLKGMDYLNEIYDSRGKLKQPISGFVNPLSGLYPVDFDGNGVYELLAFQKIAGRYNADSLGFIQNTLGWNDNKFELQNQYVAIFGS
ncbi:VCBS repeat-containing protein [Sporosarcina oncorhynchi]|uniref:VCBS repeat-containing protein n=1 Tax=Sporosarcina oncorhynchi TaxID=3056444 RepID=A0ABZ0L3C1_9BACL|nr:VCBS repeat-containing protein [Sporosarcina sp. T2O-4]WOV86669.1 VCBS repeat-containing protein [Sporosarcina sp. T2O-4]